MIRREFFKLVAGAMVGWPFASTAQEAGRMYRYGILSPFADAVVPLRRIDELQRRGFSEGRNLTIYHRDFGPHVDLISQYVAELVKAHVDIIETAGSVATRAVQQTTKTIPIIAVTDDMVGEGLVDSLVRPSGNTTGVSILATELDGKRQEILIEAVRGFAGWRPLLTPTRHRMRSFTRFRRRHAHATSSFQFTGSPESRRSRLPSTWWGHRALWRSTFWRHRCSSAMVSLLWTEYQCCAC